MRHTGHSHTQHAPIAPPPLCRVHPPLNPPPAHECTRHTSRQAVLRPHWCTLKQLSHPAPRATICISSCSSPYRKSPRATFDAWPLDPTHRTRHTIVMSMSTSCPPEPGLTDMSRPGKDGTLDVSFRPPSLGRHLDLAFLYHEGDAGDNRQANQHADYDSDDRSCR